jgi:hypothetical protein
LLAIRRGISFWVEESFDGHSSCTSQAFAEGCYRDLVYYDSAGNIWPVLAASPTRPLRWLERILPWRRITVTITLGEARPGNLNEVIGWLCSILDGDSGFDWFRGPAPDELAGLFRAARGAPDLIGAARQIEGE